MIRAAAAALLAGTLLACDAAVDDFVLSQWDSADYGLLDDGNLHVVLCGTGLPIPADGRLPACTAILADGHFLLVDAGPGTINQADLLGLPIKHLSDILVTHFHSDHIGGLGQALAHTWFRGRENTVRIHGPPGTGRIVDGFTEAYVFDTWARTLPGADELDPQWQTPEVHELTVDPGNEATVFHEGDLSVVTFAVDHRPIEPALGYRIEYKGLRVVLSGDTRYYPPLAEHARDADLLIHPAAPGGPAFLMRSFFRLQAQGLLPQVDPDLFPTPVQVAEIAQAAGVRKLVFSHIVPVDNVLFRWVFLRGVSDVYGGDAVVSEDGMRFTLTPKTL